MSPLPFLYRHPSQLDRQYVLDKLLAFHQQHGTPPHEILRDLEQAAEQIPRGEHAAEAAPLRGRYQRFRRGRRRSPQPIGTILVAVLARLGVKGLESDDEAQGPIASESDTGTDNVVVPKASAAPRKRRVPRS